MKEQVEERAAVTQDMPRAPGMRPPEVAETEGEPAWASSPETAGAKESVRREASTVLPPAQINELAAVINVPTPSERLAKEGGEIIGPEMIAEVAAQEQQSQLRERAIGDAYAVVMAGAAAAGGQPKAKAAIDAASPVVKEAATRVAKEPSTGGAPLPEKVRTKMESRFGEDFSGVQIHTGSKDVDTIGAGAAAKGEHIHFATGAFDPTSTDGEKLIGHELTHVVQQRGAAPSGKPVAAPSSSPAEQEAEKVGEKIASTKGGKSAEPKHETEHETEHAPIEPDIQVKRGTAAADAVHFGEAGVHKGIELEAAGVAMDDKFKPVNMTPEQKAALEMYSGNFMRDYSQLAAPTGLAILSNLPSTNKGGKTGAAGARALMDAIIKSIAILELGKDIGKGLVTQKNIGVYEAEQHMDNPIGTAAGNDFINEGANPQLAKTTNPKAISTFDATGGAVVAKNSSDDVDTAKAHAGSAAPGLQFENPELYKIGDGGLQNHVANSTEHSKHCFLQAVQHGATPSGRMNAGMGQHIVEDYFSHSNFIEVGLNTYINEAMRSRQAGKMKKQAGANAFIDEFADAQGNVKEGAALGAAEKRGVHAEFSFVDTLYDAKTKSGKQAVTTGTFGGTDAQVSIGHTLLPKLPVIEKALHKGVDSTFGIVEQAAKEKKKPTWQHIKTALDQSGNEGAVAQVMLEASKSIGLAVPCPSGFHLTHKEVKVPLLGSFSVPNGADLDYTNVPIADALVTGASTYVAVMEKMDSLKQATGIVGLSNVITKIMDKMKAAMAKMFAMIKQKVTELIRQMVIEMYQIDPKQAGHAGVDELTHMAERSMHEKTDRTSVESRLKKGGDLHGLTEDGDNGKKELERRVGPVRAKFENLDRKTWGSAANPWVTVNPLPPSHSEISKDHPPHTHNDKHPDWHEDGPDRKKIHDHVEHELDEAHDPNHEHDDHEEHDDLAEGSSFFGLHQALAVEADRHLQKQLQSAWNGQQLIPGKNADETKMGVKHDSILDEASRVAGQVSDSIGKEKDPNAKFRHAQTDMAAELKGRPEVKSLLDLVDLFISHPDSSLWWRSIFDNYIAQHPEQVHKEILSRNKTRSRRKSG